MRILKFFKEYSGVFAILISILSVIYTYNYNKKLSETKFSVSCNLVPNGSLSVVGKRRLSVQFQTRCYVRNIGLRRADIVDVRTALTYNGVYAIFPQELAGWWEIVNDLKINGNEFKKPFKIEPGSQATVDLKLNYPIDSSEIGSKIESRLRTCGIGKIVSQVSLSKCLGQEKLLWTDYIKSGGHTETLFNGIGGTFQLSDGSFIMDEVSFKYGWFWRWDIKHNSLSDIPNLPKYMEESFYRNLNSRK